MLRAWKGRHQSVVRHMRAVIMETGVESEMRLRSDLAMMLMYRYSHLWRLSWKSRC